MKTLIKATHKKWIEKIKSGEKTYELGKGFQNVEVPFKDFIYEPKNGGGCGMVVGEYICNKKIKINYPIENNSNQIAEGSCVSRKEMLAYTKNETAKNVYALHITSPKFYDKPKELSEFYITKKCVPVNSYFGDKQNWDDRHKRCSASLPRESWGIPIECHRCKNLYVAKEPYLDEKSGCMLFDYDCKTKYHKPIARAPQNYCKCEQLEEIE